MRGLSTFACLLLGAATLQAQYTSTTHKPPAHIWGTAPAVFPAGSKMAVLNGDPAKAALNLGKGTS